MPKNTNDEIEEANAIFDDKYQDDIDNIRPGFNSVLRNSNNENPNGFDEKRRKTISLAIIGITAAGLKIADRGVNKALDSFEHYAFSDPWQADDSFKLDQEGLTLIQSNLGNHEELKKLANGHHDKTFKLCVDIIVSVPQDGTYVEATAAMGRLKNNHDQGVFPEAYRFLSLLYARYAVFAGKLSAGVAALEAAVNSAENMDEKLLYTRQSLNHAYISVEKFNTESTDEFHTRMADILRPVEIEAFILPEQYSQERVDDLIKIDPEMGAGIAVMESLGNCIQAPADTELREKLFEIQTYAIRKHMEHDQRIGWLRYTPAIGAALNMGENRIAAKILEEFNKIKNKNTDYTNTRVGHPELFYLEIMSKIIQLRTNQLSSEDFRVFFKRSRLKYNDLLTRRIIDTYIAETAHDNVAANRFAATLDPVGTHRMYFPPPITQEYERFPM